MRTPITRDECRLWLEGIVQGIVWLDRDNEAMAAAVLAYLDDQTVPPGNLTPHFSLAEMIASDTAAMNGIDNTPSDEEIASLTDTCELLELVRALCDESAVMVSSGFRCADLNAAVGGATNSAHLYGCAADITVPSFGTPLDVCRAVEPYVTEWGIDQLIYEQTWVHIGRAIPPSTEPRCQCLTINSAGTFNGIVA